MSANWARRLTRWPAHINAGQVFDMSHVHPFRYSLKLAETPVYPAREVDVRVGFSAHTFTRSCKQDEEPHAAYSRENDLRVFCESRYALSKWVPDVIRNLDGRDCFYGNRDNYLVIELPEIVTPGFQYWIFFDVRPVDDDPNAILVFVQSAYVGSVDRPPYGRRPKRVGFRVLVNLALRRRRPKRPP